MTETVTDLRSVLTEEVPASPAPLALGTVSETDLLREQIAKLTDERDALTADRNRAQALAASRATELEDFKTRVQEIGYRYADDNDLCSVFDRCMEEIGLPGRPREFTVCVDATVHVHVTVEASSEDDAADNVDSDSVRYAIREAVQRYGSLDITDWSTGTVE